MPLAVTLRVDESDAAPLLDLQDEAAAFAASLREPGYGPHVTLAIHDGLEMLEIGAAAAQLFDGAVAVELIFEAVRWFDGPSLTLYAAPAPSQDLDELVRKLNRTQQQPTSFERRRHDRLKICRGAARRRS